MGLVYTTIQHTFRKLNNLSCNEYVLADMVYFLSTSPESKIKGWCYMSRNKLGEELGLSKQSVLNIIEGLVTKGFIEKDQDTSYLKTTPNWNCIYIEIGKESLPPVKKVYPPAGKESLPRPGKESLPKAVKKVYPIIDIVSNINDNDSISLSVNTDNGQTSDRVREEGQTGTPKNSAAGPLKIKTCYELFLELYWDWFKLKNDGIPPKIDGAGGKAAKSLIEYFKKIVKARAEKEDRIVEDLDADVIKTWGLVLDNWTVLEPFIQDKTKLMEINSNIQNIIVQIKNNGTTKRNQQSTSGASTGAGGVVNAINNRFNQGGGSPNK